MFGNRLGKNLKRLKGWAERGGISCYRLYDADMPEYAFAIDSYRTLPEGLAWLYVQEYAAPDSVDVEAARRRRNEALSVLPQVTGVPLERIRVRMRRQQKGSEQYEKMGEQARFHVVEEAGLKFQVNFDDYLDTGLFLDHRPLFPGHSLLVPRDHHEAIWDLPDDLLEPLFANARLLAVAIRQATGSTGAFVAANNIVSQSVPHFHVHVVPRNRKDGLRGFFWPRLRYRDAAHMAEVAGALRDVLSTS